MIAVVSTVIFSLFFGFIQYVPKEEQEPNVLYMSFVDIISACAIFSAPVFLLGGIPSSMLIDKINKRWDFSSKLEFYIFNFVVKYHRTISTLINSLIKNGFTLEEIIEPQSIPVGLERMPKLINEKRRPSFIIIKCIKSI